MWHFVKVPNIVCPSQVWKVCFMLAAMNCSRIAIILSITLLPLHSIVTLRTIIVSLSATLRPIYPYVATNTLICTYLETINYTVTRMNSQLEIPNTLKSRQPSNSHLPVRVSRRQRRHWKVS
jgi:hypothetical protein